MNTSAVSSIGSEVHIMKIHGPSVVLLLMAAKMGMLTQAKNHTIRHHKKTRADVMKDLLKGYDKWEPPSSGPTVVELGIYINSFYAISEQTMDYSINIYLRQQWTDPRLADKKNKTRGMLKLEDGMWEKIWVPDVFFRNEKQAQYHYVTIPNRLLRLFPDGRVWYASKITATLTCPMDLAKYPLDEQKCPMMFESFGNTLDAVNFKWLTDPQPLDMGQEPELPQFRYVGYELQTCRQNYSTVGNTMETLHYKWLQPKPVAGDSNLELPQYRYVGNKLMDCLQNYTTGAYPCLQIDFILKRDIGYYLIQLYIPSVLIVILSWVAFWISIDAIPARVTIGLLTVLTMTTQSTGARSQLPRVSYIKAIDVWMSTCLLFVFASLLEFAVVNVFSRKEMRRNRTLNGNRKLKEEHVTIEQIKVVTRNGRDFKEVKEKRPFVRDGEGRNRARYIDKLARKMFPLSFVLFNLIYWLTYKFA
ncbi:unnamed protein product [Owenia fusiformis]|uniref:Uncharacterized protein n=1 Tax=Owenia fusiformis TaxID=6347 RepID=A0A8S4MUI1_OWEFU|nr:unnamed protein product [Owenia fusiformis]